MIFAGFLVAALLGASALAKIRMDRRTGMGTAPATLLEAATALLIAVLPMLSGSLPVYLVALGFTVSVAASVMQFSRYRAEGRRRENTEGGRLAAYVRYLSAADGSDPDEGTPPVEGDATNGLSP